MSNLTPFVPNRPLIWPDSVLDLCNHLVEYKQPIFIIGGAVRDAYLHRPIYDVDLSTPENAIKLAKHIANLYDGGVFVMDRERDVARVFIDLPKRMTEERLIVDVARFRGVSLYSDLQDRDFTINAMAVDICSMGELIDPLQGVADIEARILRRCSNHTIGDDSVRALRAIRQSVQFNFRIEPETLTDIRQVNDRLLSTSSERLRDELFKILSLKRPVAALRVADRLGLLGIFVPEVIALHNFDRPSFPDFNVWAHTLTVIEKLSHLMTVISPRRIDTTVSAFDFGMVVMALDRFRTPLQQHLANLWPNERSHEALLLLVALLHEVESADLVENRAIALRLSNDEKQRIGQVIHTLPLILSLDDKPSDIELHRFWYRVGVAGVDACILALADYLGMVGNEIDQDEWLCLLQKVQKVMEAYFLRYHEIVMPPTLVDGHQLMNALNLQPGPHIKKLLDFIREGQVMKTITTPDIALEAARQFMGTSS